MDELNSIMPGGDAFITKPYNTAILLAKIAALLKRTDFISAEISAYIGLTALMLQIGATVGILAILLLCYFISTWILFRRFC